MACLPQRVLVLVAPLVIASSACGQAPPPATVVVASVHELETLDGQPSVATVMPSRRATVGSAVSGRVVEFLVNEGDLVAEGQPLAKLLTETISADIAAAQGELDLRQQELLELEHGTRPEEVARDQAKMMAAKALFDYLNARRQRVERLFEQGASVTQEQRDEAVANAENANYNYRDALHVHELSQAGPRQEKIAQARARVAVQKATLDKLNDQLKKHTIISRFAGFVTAEHTEEGAWVNQGDPVAEIAALDDVDVQAFVVEQSVRHVQIGMSVRVEIPALPNESFLGEVSLIVPQADLRARTFPVKIRVKNQLQNHQPLIKAGMSARVILPTGEKTISLLVPKDALVLNANQSLVFITENAATPRQPMNVKPVPVELGAAVGNWIQVKGQLKVGQQVVVKGNERLRPGQAIQVEQVLPDAPRPDPHVSASSF